MIIKIKKRDLLIVSIALFLIILIPIIYAQTKTPKTGTFGVWLVIGNQNPVNISLNNVTTLLSSSQFSVDPSSASTKTILISFNASDPDGPEQINGTNGGKVIVNLTLGTPGNSQFRTQTSCVNTTINNVAGSKHQVIFNCTIDMKYYDNASSSWVINITVIDSNSGSARNDSAIFTYNSLAAFSLIARGVSEGANLNFSSLFLNDQNKVAKAPLLLNNTGNNDFDQINITAAALIGLQTASEIIAASSFAVNVTNNTNGLGLPLSNAPQIIPFSDASNATLLHGPGISGDNVPYPGVADFKTKGNQTLLFWIDVPAYGLSAQTYNNTWNITVVDLS